MKILFASSSSCSLTDFWLVWVYQLVCSLNRVVHCTFRGTPCFLIELLFELTEFKKFYKVCFSSANDENRLHFNISKRQSLWIIHVLPLNRLLFFASVHEGFQELNDEHGQVIDFLALLMGVWISFSLIADINAYNIQFPDLFDQFFGPDGALFLWVLVILRMVLLLLVTWSHSPAFLSFCWVVLLNRCSTVFVEFLEAWTTPNLGTFNTDFLNNFWKLVFWSLRG